MTANKVWTVAEVEELRRLYAHTSNDELATLFGRARDNVFDKAYRLGLRKSKEYVSALNAKNNTGKKPPTTKPIGGYMIVAGILKKKVSDNPIKSKRWRPVHHLVWIEVNGPIPDRHMLVFKPGMRTNILEEITLDKLECVSLEDHILRHSCNNLPPELREIVHLQGQLTKQINRRIKDGTEH